MFEGNAVYVNTTGKKVLSDQDYLTYTVIKPTTSTNYFSPGAVKLKATSDYSISGNLNIPSIIYNYAKVGGVDKYYPYAVTEVEDAGFEKQEKITSVYFLQDPNLQASSYQVTTIGKNAFAGTTGLTGTLQLPRSITSIGDNAFGVNTTTPIANVVIGANSTGPLSLTVGADVFKGRTITNLHLLGNFGSNITISNNKALFSKDNVTNVYYYGDGKDDSYYDFLTAINNKGFGLPGQNLYLPSDEIKSFVENCTANNHTGWIPSTINCLTFEHEVNGIGKFTFMITTTDIQNGGALLAVHAAKFYDEVTNPTLDFSDDKKWKTDLMPTATSLTPDVTMIDSKAFAGNDNLQSITIIPYSKSKSVTLKGDAFSGVKSLRYIDLSQSGDFNVADGYTLSRIPTTTFDENTPYKYTKGTDGKGTYDYELTSTNPFGGLPAYTLVFLPTNIEKYPSGSTETVYKTNGTTATDLTRPLDENFVLWNSDDEKYTCNNFGVYDITALDNTKATGQNYSWYSFLNPHEFTAANSKFYRQFSAGVPSSVCLPFQPAATSNGKFYTYKSADDKHIVITTVDDPKANTPYFFYPSNNAPLSNTSQTIGAVTTAEEMTSKNLYGVYAGKSFAKVSNAYGMASTAFTYNGKDYPAGTFVKFTDKAYLNPFRAYLLLNGTSPKSAVMEMVVDDTPTGITNQPTASNAETSYYNLQGMRVAAPTKGIFIHNGKKIVK